MTKRLVFLSTCIVLALGTSALAGEGQEKQESRPRYAEAVIGFPGQGGYLGVQLTELTGEKARSLGVAERGAHVVEVVQGGPAAAAGLQKDDVIVSWNGDRIESAMQLTREVRETPSGRSVKLGVLRGGRQMDLEVKLGEHSFGNFRFESLPGHASLAVRSRARLGVGLQSLTPQLAEYFGMSGRTGMLIASVSENSAAAKAGLKAGDVVLSVDGQQVQRQNDISNALRGKENTTVDIKVLRDKQERSFKVQVERGNESSLFFENGDFKMFENGHFKLFDPSHFVIPALPEVRMPAVRIPRIEMPRIQIPRFTMPLNLRVPHRVLV